MIVQHEVIIAKPERKQTTGFKQDAGIFWLSKRKAREKKSRGNTLAVYRGHLYVCRVQKTYGALFLVDE